MNENEEVEIPSMIPMITSAKKSGEIIVVAVKGNVDVKNSPDLRKVLLGMVKDHPVKKLCLDLSGVSYMDSSAIAVLVEVLKKMKETGGKVYLAAVQPRVQGLLEIARLDKIFVVAKTVEEARTK